MTRKVYRTAQGRMVDIGALQLQNENVRAVGNMGVNARGDLLDTNNNPIKTRNQQVKKQYDKQMSNVSNTPVRASAKPAPAKKASFPPPPPPPEDFNDDFIRDPAEPAAAPATDGLAAAIARSRQHRQHPGNQEEK